MGWLWGSNNNDSNKDPLNKLDPSLRDFLDKESKTRQQQQQQQPTSQARDSPSYSTQIGIPEKQPEKQPEQQQAQKDENAVPSQSLYQDGRYAHLWKNYRPQEQIEQASRSESERLADVIDTYNDRKARIGRAAVENCALEQWAEHECFSNGGIEAKFFLCKEETRAFNRCYTMQSRFLKALGYLSMERSADEEERIQMHADKLYHEMLDREKAMKEAEEKNLPVPTFKPLVTSTSVSEALGAQQPAQPAPSAATQQQPQQQPQREGLDMYAGEKRKALEQSLADKTPAEREIELQLMAGEARANAEYAAVVHKHFEAEKKLREDRKERGRETIGDTIKRVWGWDSK